MVNKVRKQDMIKTPDAAGSYPRQTYLYPHLCAQLHHNHLMWFKVTVKIQVFTVNLTGWYQLFIPKVQHKIWNLADT